MRQAPDSDTRTTGGFADGDEFQAITTAEYFSNRTRQRGGCLKGPPRERTTPSSIIYYVTRRERARHSSTRGTGHDPPTGFLSHPASALVHHCTLFIRRNLNYTFDRTLRRTTPPRFQSKRDATMLNTLPHGALRLRSNNRQRLRMPECNSTLYEM